MFPPEKLNPQTKNFFSDFDSKTCWIRKGFEQLSSSIAWQVIGLQSSARKVAHAGLKGLDICKFKITICMQHLYVEASDWVPFEMIYK